MRVGFLLRQLDPEVVAQIVATLRRKILYDEYDRIALDKYLKKAETVLAGNPQTCSPGIEEALIAACMRKRKVIRIMLFDETRQIQERNKSKCTSDQERTKAYE